MCIGVVWTGFNWLRIGFGGGLFWTRLWALRLDQILGISGVAERLATSQGAMRYSETDSMEWHAKCRNLDVSGGRIVMSRSHVLYSSTLRRGLVTASPEHTRLWYVNAHGFTLISKAAVALQRTSNALANTIVIFVKSNFHSLFFCLPFKRILLGK
jgi:hypothetical protein